MKSTGQNTISHITVKQYIEGDMHSDCDTEMKQVVGAPQKKKQKTKNNNVRQGESKEKMMSKVSKE